MKLRNRMIVVMSIAVWLIGSGITHASGVETISHTFEAIGTSPIFVPLQGGPGPVCYPGIGCGNTQTIGAWRGGGGPVCYPGIGCGNAYAFGVWRGGPGPVCFPDISGCTQAQAIGIWQGEPETSMGVLKDGPGPLCWPGSGGC
jgi:hypothetical protein